MKKIFRIIIDIVIFFSVLNGYWPIALILSLIGLFLFEKYFEIIIFGLMYDSLFGYVSIHTIYGYMATIVCVVCFATASLVKKALR